MQFIEQVDHTSQGRLVTQFAFQYGNRWVSPRQTWTDLHTSQTIRPVCIKAALHVNLVDGWAVKRQWFLGCWAHK